jgi:hypothetical protein
MIGGLLAGWIGISKLTMRFPHQRGKGPVVTREIMDTFAEGCACGLREEPLAKFQEALKSRFWHQRSYYCEGHAMGLAARSAIGRRPYNPDVFYHGDSFLAARLIGYGFWNGVASRYRLPALHSGTAYWRDVPRWEELRPLIANGASYGRILARGRFDAGEIMRIRETAGAEDCEAALHGAGRVLWLLYMYNFDALRTHLEACGEQRQAVALGLGFAIGFMHAREAQEIPAMLNEFGQEGHAVARGAGIALALHTCNDTESCLEVSAQLTGALQSPVAAARQAAESAGTGEGWYGRFCARAQGAAVTGFS